jgi:Na+/proline symporter
VTPLLWGVLGYVALQLLIGAWVSRFIANETDYWLAGRRLGPGLALFSVFATWFGAETCIASAGAIYEEGLAGGSADPFGYATCLLLMGLLLAAPLWRRRLTTLADLFRQRFSPGVERLSVVLLVPTSLLWAAAQIRAFGQVLSASSEFGLELTVAVAALLVVIYSALGGLLADVVTDLVQGVVLILGLVLLGAMLAFDSAHGFAAALGGIDPARLDPLGGAGLSAATLERWAIPVLGSLVAQELISRVSASRSARVARGATLGAALVYFAVGLIPALIGLAGPALMPELDHSEQLLPHVAQALLPPVLQILFLGALVSAILSTVDSALLAASSLLVHNLLLPLRPGLGEARKLRLARAGVVVCGCVAWLLARRAESVYALVEDASAFGSAGILVATCFAFSRVGGPHAAHAALWTGALGWLSGSALALETPYLLSLGAALLAYLLVASGERARA